MKRTFFKGARIVVVLAIPTFSFAQNTIDGKLAVVPEKEVNRQSAYIDAERERLLEHWDDAEKAYKDFLRENAGHSAAWYNLARVQAAQDKLGEALNTIGKAIDIDAENQWFYIYQADLLNRMGRSEDAAKVYEQLVKKYPDEIGYMHQLSFLQTLSGNPEAALKTIDKIENKAGFSPEIAQKKHILYDGMGNTKKAASELERLTRIYPNQISFKHQLAEYYRDIGSEKEARQVYEQILKLDPDDPVANLALGARSTGDQQDQVLSNPDVTLDVKLQELIPKLEAFQQSEDPALFTQLQAAASALEQAHPDDPRTWSFSGDVYFLANKPDEALLRYQKCLEYPQTPFTVWENTLRILYEQQQHEDVIATANKAMDFWPNQPESYLYYGLSSIALGKKAQARSMLNQARLMTLQSDDEELKAQIQKALDAAGK